MTDDEFERLKAEEKKQLRAKQQFQKTLEALKRQNKVQSTVRRMRSAASRLLRENEDLVDGLRSWTARQAARLEVALSPEDETTDDWVEAEEELRKARAAELVRQYKSATAGGRATRSEDSNSSRRDEAEADEADANENDAGDPMPEKTIGRMHKRPDTPDT
ncbi:MAG: hypothetical protein ACLFTE_07565 [Salinivenus sp.]